jgi:UDP-N-acetylglucosamine 4,6-dehydratase
MVWHRVDQFRQQLLRLPRRKKRVLQVVVDVVLVWIALWLAFVVRLGDFGAVHPFAGHGWLFISAPLIALPLFIRFGMYRAVMRYLGNDALVAIAKAVSLSALILALVVYWYRESPIAIPRSMVFNYWWLSLVLLGGLRLMMRQFFMGDWFDPNVRTNVARGEGRVRVAIYGAGAAGNQLVAALRMGRLPAG